MPRLVSSAGVDDTSELRAFVGSQIKGAEDVKITASILPKSRALQFQTLMQLAPLVGQDIRPHVARFMEGSYDEFITAETAQRNRQKRENSALAALATYPQRDQVYKDFIQLQSKYMEAVQIAISQGQDPMQTLMASGIQPPQVLNMLRDAGVAIPTVEDYDDHAQHMRMLDDWRLSDGYDAVHPLVKQAAREHADQHKKALAQTMLSIGAQQPMPQPGQQQGSQPAPKGQPSPPKQPGQPAGQSTDIDVISGFGNGFSKEVEAILNVADRGLLYPREIRENLAKTGMIIYEEVALPDVDPPALPDESPHTVNPEEFEDFSDDEEIE
jgi:hypothetical protein